MHHKEAGPPLLPLDDGYNVRSVKSIIHKMHKNRLKTCINTI